MFHRLNLPVRSKLKDSDRCRQNVSTPSGLFALGRIISDALQVFGLEFLLGPMQQNAQIVALDT
jgi:hypothetical protein